MPSTSMWLLAVACVVPGAYFVRLFVRPALTHGLAFAREMLPLAWAKSAARDGAVKTLQWSPFRKVLVLLGTMPVWQGALVVAIVAIIVGVLMSTLTEWCCPTPAGVLHQQRQKDEAASRPTSPSTQKSTTSTQQGSKSTAPKAKPRYRNPQAEQEAAAAKALDSEIQALISELGQVESELQGLGVGVSCDTDCSGDAADGGSPAGAAGEDGTANTGGRHGDVDDVDTTIPKSASDSDAQPHRRRTTGVSTS